MPREVIADLPCLVKYDLGDSDLRAGSRGLVNLLRAQDLVEQIRQRPRQDGQPVERVVVRMPHLTAEGVEELTSTVGELDAHLQRLEPLVPYCTNCPANALRRPFGCVGGLPQPISKALEAYALERLASPTRIGGALLLQTLHDRGIDGSVAREFRVSGKFEALLGPSRKLDPNLFDKPTLSTDELFEPLLVVNGKFSPWMSLNVLLWFDGITLDDRLPTTIDDVLALTRMEQSERPRRTKCHLGESKPQVEPFRGFLKLLHIGWSRDLDILIDS